MASTRRLGALWNVIAIVIAIVIGSCDGGGASDGGTFSPDGAPPDGAFVSPPGLDEFLAENRIVPMELGPDGIERGTLVTPADGVARFFSRRHGAVLAFEVEGDDGAPLSGVEVVAEATEARFAYLLHDPSGATLPVFFSTDLPAPGEHRHVVDSADLLLRDAPVHDFDPAAGNPFREAFSFVGILSSTLFQTILRSVVAGVAIELLRRAVLTTCRTISPVHVELCDRIAAVVDGIASAVAGFRVFGATAFGALATFVGEALAPECAAVGASLAGYVRDPTDQTNRRSYGAIAHRYNYLLHRLVNDPPPGGAGPWLDTVVREGAELAQVGRVVRDAYFEAYNPSPSLQLRESALNVAADVTGNMLSRDRTFRELVLVSLEIEEGYLAILRIRPDGATFSLRQWRVVRGTFAEIEVERALPGSSFFGPLTSCTFGIVEGLLGQLERDGAILDAEAELDANGLVQTMLRVWDRRVRFLYEQAYGEEMPTTCEFDDEFEPNQTWQQAVARPVPTILDGSGLVRAPDLRICPLPGARESDWYAWPSGPIELRVQAAIVPEPVVAGQELCFDLHFYSEIYEIAESPPDHIRGPFCGASGVVASDQFGIRRTLGERWSYLLMHVYPREVESGAFVYEARFTP